MEETMADMRVQLEVWVDVACPWCFLGRRHLGVAIADLEEHERPDVIWRAFELDPTIPEDGIDAETYIEARFGDSRGVFDASRERLVAMGEEVGIDFRFDRQRTIANSRLAHRVLAAARMHEEGEPMLDALFSAYFERGVDISSIDNLRELVLDHVVDPDLATLIVDAALTDAEIARRVDEDIAMARELQITGVPCFVADRRIAVPGAVPPPVLAQLIAQASARRTNEDDD